MSKPHDVVIVGGGVIGLSLAWELARRGRRVRVMERNAELGREASWAGAGMLPATPTITTNAFDQLMALSRGLHEEWAARLKRETSVDTGFCINGALYVARTAGERASLRAWQRACEEQGLASQWLDAQALRRCEPALNGNDILGACRLADEAQVRNPDHLHALALACEQKGVQLSRGARVLAMDHQQGIVETATEKIHAKQVCVTAGPWTRQLLAGAAWAPDVFPVRGQMVLIHGAQRFLSHTINEGPRYLVPRLDGRVLVGSTEEEVGFVKETTEEAIASLRAFAVEMAPILGDSPVERVWAGLRPGSFDGFPYLGRAPGCDRIFVATGHFRNGLNLSTGTALLMAQLMCGEPLAMELERFRVGR